MKVCLTLEEFGMLLNLLVDKYNADEKASKNVFINYWNANGKNRNAELFGIDWKVIFDEIGLRNFDENKILELTLEIKVFLGNL
jgi:hypothetical protein